MKVYRKKPVNFSEEHYKHFEKEFEREIIPYENLDLKNVFVNTEGFIFSYFLTITQNISKDRTNFSFLSEKKFCLGQFIKKSIKKTNPNKKYSILFDTWTTGYFHWFADILPKLIKHESLLKNTIILFPQKFNKSFYKESLKCFPQFEFDFFQENEIVKITNGVYIGNLAISGNYDEEIMKKLRKIFTNFYSENIIVPTRNIYISRSKALRRRVVNEKELIPILEKYNFEILNFEDLSFEEQVKTILSTKNLISIHGAGLMNLLFMAENQNVLEFKLKNDFISLYFFSLASALNINYYYQMADLEHEKTETFDGNFIIDKNLLEKNINSMLQ